MEVNLYIKTNIKSPKIRKGVGGYVLEAVTSKAPATLTHFTPIEATAIGAETEILLLGLRRIVKPSQLTIYTDQRFVATALERWLPLWKKNDWKNAKGKTVDNVDKWLEIEYLLQAQGFKVAYKQDHPYREWMENEIKRRKP
jgi:ribonuclease HI